MCFLCFQELLKESYKLLVEGIRKQESQTRQNHLTENVTKILVWELSTFAELLPFFYCFIAFTVIEIVEVLFKNNLKTQLEDFFVKLRDQLKHFVKLLLVCVKLRRLSGIFLKYKSRF